MSERVLVTGAAGFIGSHLVERLVADGHTVRALVRYNSRGSHGWLPEIAGYDGVEVLSGDVRDAEQMRRMLGGCSVVFHLAALIGIPYSYDAPRSYIDTNVVGTLNVLEAARDAGARVVQTSTSEVYGTAQRWPMDETHPMRAQSPYAASKIAADQLALSYHRSFGLPVTVVRPFNTFGPRQSSRAVIPTILSQLLAGREEIRLGSLHPTRDFNFVLDIAAGFCAAGRSDAAVGEVVNLGTGHEVAIKEIVEVAGALLGMKASAVVDQNRVRPKASEVDRLVCDATKARDTLGWAPEFAGADGFSRAIASTIAWLRHGERLGLYASDRYGV